jgi:hypothetical protein
MQCSKQRHIARLWRSAECAQHLVGPGHCLFVAPVSKWWKEIYSTLKSQQLTVFAENDYETATITCASKKTLLSSVFASPSRVEFAVKSGLACTSGKYERAAGKYADIATLAAAHSLGMEYTESTIAAAADCNKLAEVQYLHEQGCPWPSYLLDRAASKGDFELVRWCYEHGCPFGDAGMASCHAAQSSNVELMAWVLQQPGTQVHADDMCYAAWTGCAAMCEFLRAQQCPWDSRSTSAAAHICDVELLRWFFNNGCPWHVEELCTAAAEGGSIEVLTYLQQQGVLTSTALLTGMLEAATDCNELAAAKWLRQQGAEWPAVLNCMV